MTAVEYLEHIYLTTGIDRDVHFNQAKEMERKEIVYAYTYGQKNIIDIVSKELKFSFAKTNEELRKVIENKENNEDAEQYYNETYKPTPP